MESNGNCSTSTKVFAKEQQLFAPQWAEDTGGYVLIAVEGRNVLREVEVSITRHCTLACSECGFLVPHQPEPAHGDPVVELSSCLARLGGLGIQVGSLAILGGEPTIDGALLERAVVSFRQLAIARRIEVVSNGLTPRGLSRVALGAIDRLTISVYGLDASLLEQWAKWLARVAPHVELSLRYSAGGWDAWTEQRSVSPEHSQRLYEDCWYRKHCVTIERGRLFSW